MSRTPIVVLVMMGLSLTPARAAERPSRDEVARAVAESQAAYVASRRPTLESVTEHVELLQRNLDQAKKRQDKKLMRNIGEDLLVWKKKLAAARRGKFDEVEPRLMPLVWKKLTVGMVGRLDDGDQNNIIIVDQLLEEGRFLGHSRMFSIVKDPIGRPKGTRESESEAVLFVGFAKNADLQEGSQFRPTTDAVVTGQFAYTTAFGTINTVPMLEPFDSTKPFD